MNDDLTEVAELLQERLQVLRQLRPMDEGRVQQILAENTCPECGHTFGYHRIPGRETSGCSQSPYRDLAAAVKDCDV